MRPEGWLEAELVRILKGSPCRGKRRFLGNETRSWEVADVRLDEASEHLDRTLALLELAYETHWSYLGEQPGGLDDPELIDEYDASLDPLDAAEHERLVIGDSVKEAVSVAEVYLDDLARHVRPHLADGVPRKTLSDGLDRHSFARLVSGYEETFGIELRARSYWDEWSEVRASRHLLTHNWGRYNGKYFADAERRPDVYAPRLPEHGWGPATADEAEASTERISLSADYARRSLSISRLLIDDVEAELGATVRKHRIDWFS